MNIEQQAIVTVPTRAVSIMNEIAAALKERGIPTRVESYGTSPSAYLKGVGYFAEAYISIGSAADAVTRFKVTRKRKGSKYREQGFRTDKLSTVVAAFVTAHENDRGLEVAAAKYEAERQERNAKRAVEVAKALAAIDVPLQAIVGSTGTLRGQTKGQHQIRLAVTPSLDGTFSVQLSGNLSAEEFSKLRKFIHNEITVRPQA